MAKGSAWKSRRSKRCFSCYAEARKAATAERGREIEAMWAEGATHKEIGARYGWTVNHVGMEIRRLRAKGFDLPYRRSVYPGRTSPVFPDQVPDA